MRASLPLLQPSPRPPLTPLQARSWPLTIPLPVEGAESEESSGEADDGEAEAWGLADVRELHPGLLAHRAARTRDLPALATALAHGAEVNWADAEDEGKTPLVQAVLGVSRRRGGGGSCAGHGCLFRAPFLMARTQAPLGPSWRPRRGHFQVSLNCPWLPRAP